MWTFQGPRAIQSPDTTTRDSFTRALADLDQIPLTYNPNRRDRLSGQFDDGDDIHSEVSEQFRKNTLTWASGDTDSTLKVGEEPERSSDDLQLKGDEPVLGPPLPVGFWHPSLRETRWTVLKKYSWTCEYCQLRSSTQLTGISINPLRLRPRSTIDLLGGFVQSKREPTSCYHCCRRFRRPGSTIPRWRTARGAYCGPSYRGRTIETRCFGFRDSSPSKVQLRSPCSSSSST